MKAMFFAALFSVSSLLAGLLPDVDRIDLPGEYRGHLQSVVTDGTNIWWSQTYVLLKTDLQGNIISSTKDEGNWHHGGMCLKDGKIYSGICLLPDPDWPRSTRPLQVWVYDAQTLTCLRKIVFPGIIDRAGSIDATPEGFIVGCLRPQEIGPSCVRLHLFDKEFNRVKSPVVDCGKTFPMGTENIYWHDGGYLLSIYYKYLVQLDKNFKPLAHCKQDGQMGAIFDGKWYWQGEHTYNKETKKHRTWLRRIPADNWTWTSFPDAAPAK